VGQGAIGVECRAEDAQTRALLQLLNDPDTHDAVLAERAALRDLEGGCMIPLGAWGRIADKHLALDVAVFDSEGRERVAASRSGSRTDPVAIGREVASQLRALGAERLLQCARSG
jgi:hydroxymethylbilane synthase